MASADQGIWLGLLKWSLQHSDGTAPSLQSSMSDEDKSFLEKVMREYTRDEPARMREIMVDLVVFVEPSHAARVDGDAPTPKSDEEVEALLEELRDIVEQIDMAQVFAKFGGLQCILAVLEKTSAGVDCRAMACSVLACLAQNNLHVQEQIYAQGLVARLSILTAQYLMSPSDGQRVFGSKILHALSCSIRNHPAAEELFSLAHAHAVLGAAMVGGGGGSLWGAAGGGRAACMRRAVYLAEALLSSDTCSAARLGKIVPAVVPACFGGLCGEDVDLREGTLRLLLAVLGSTVGHAALCTGGVHHDALLAALAQRRSVSLADDDQEAHERNMVERVEEMSKGGFSGAREMAAAEEGPDDVPAASVLLLGP